MPSMGPGTPVTPRPGTRIQRRTTLLPVLHLEPEIPAPPAWELQVDGLVSRPCAWTADDLHAVAPEERVWDLHCVWGWTRPGCRWEGIPAGRLIDEASPLPRARYVVVGAFRDGYASCYPLHRARRCLLAWRLDGRELTPEHGWPVRLVPPPTKWAYKAVKWVTRLTLVEEFTPGFWEGLVGDPHGDIPADVLAHVDAAELQEGGTGAAET